MKTFDIEATYSCIQVFTVEAETAEDAEAAFLRGEGKYSYQVECSLEDYKTPVEDE